MAYIKNNDKIQVYSEKDHLPYKSFSSVEEMNKFAQENKLSVFGLEFVDNGHLYCYYRYENDAVINEGIPVNFYDIRYDKYGNTLLVEKHVNTEHIVEDYMVLNLADEIEQFFNSEEKYKKYNIPFKKNYLYYGPPGNGKTTSLLHSINKLRTKYNILFISGVDKLQGFYNVYDNLKEKNTILIIEEVTNGISSTDEMRKFLNFLDGVDSKNNVVTICTTNYPEELPMNIVDRPGRFKDKIRIGNPNKEQIQKILEYYKLKEDPKLLDGFSLDYILAIIQDHLITDESIEDCIKRYKKDQEEAEKQFRQKQNIGMY